MLNFQEWFSLLMSLNVTSNNRTHCNFSIMRITLIILDTGHSFCYYSRIKTMIVKTIIKIGTKMNKTLLALSTVMALGSTAFADDTSEIAELKQQMAELQENQQAMIDETSDSQVGFTTVDSSFSHNGMGAAASKVYMTKDPLSIGGYGEMYFAAPDNGDNYADLYRFVPYIGYKFSDNIILNTELEFEHGGANPEILGGEGYAVVEFMYLDFLINKAFNVQLGHFLVPMGLINLRHEPTLFNTVQRPLTEKYIIPSTWGTNGINAYGTIGDTGVSYNAGFIQALDLNNADNGTKGQVREGRPGSTGKPTFENAAFVGRLDYRGINGLLIGGSMYYGSATQGSVKDSNAFIYDLHGLYEVSGFKVKAVYSATSISNAENIARTPTPSATPNQSIKDSNGYFVNFEYDLLTSFASTQKLPLFAQYDYINPAATVVDALATTTATNISESATTTVGINYFPHEQVVLKMDYAMTDVAAAGAEDYNTFSVGLGFIF